jgi:hypothetical protein
MSRLMIEGTVGFAGVTVGVGVCVAVEDGESVWVMVGVGVKTNTVVGDTADGLAQPVINPKLSPTNPAPLAKAIRCLVSLGLSRL